MPVRIALVVMLTVLIGAGPVRGETTGSIPAGKILRFAPETADALKGSAALLRSRMQECTEAQVRKLVKSGEAAATLADAALTICRNAVEDAVEGGVQLRRVETRRGLRAAEERQLRLTLRQAIREAVLSDAVAVRADDNKRREEATKSAERVASQPIENLKKAVTRCLEVFGAKLLAQFKEGDDAVEPITEMCRPEIEALARGTFLADNSVGLPKARDEALAFAITTASKLFHGQGT